jgi:hypothetical protein
MTVFRASPGHPSAGLAPNSCLGNHHPGWKEPNVMPSALYVVPSASARGKWLLRLVAAALIGVIGAFGVGLVRAEHRLDRAPALNAAVTPETAMTNSLESDPVLSARIARSD